uniref:hypothetical protein n=1 Tax=Vibrio sp. V23_P3S9T160 TaxID=1938675 RepID=UPI001384080C
VLERYLIDGFSLKVNRLLVDSIFLASTIKPVEFSDEREVRLLYIGNNKESTGRYDSDGLNDIYKKPTLPDVGYKSKSDILVSYQPIPFSISSVKSVTIGPSTNPKLAELGLTEFRDRNNFSFDILHSSCSLRRL